MKTPKTGMVAVKFSQGWAVYHAGEVAGFTEKEAAFLVNKLRVASYLVQPSADVIQKHDAIMKDDPIITHPVSVADIAANPVTPTSSEHVAARSKRWLKK